MTLIRKEQPQDLAAIYQVVEQAFGQADEAKLVDRLRANGKAVVSLVAIKDRRVVGHILFSEVTFASALCDVKAIGLAPMAVLPQLQNQGIGSQLVKAGLDECRELGYEVVVVLGHAKYYPRFGFVPSVQYHIKSQYAVPDDHFLVMELRQGALNKCSGIVGYQPEFNE
ncbi:MAG: N-acetyltransferase [Acidobacteriota bacterium]